MGEEKTDLVRSSYKTLPGIRGRNYTQEGVKAGENLAAYNKVLAEINSKSEELYQGVTTGLTHLLTMTDIESKEPVVIGPGAEARIWENRGFFNRTYGGYLQVTNPEEERIGGFRRYYGSPAKRTFNFEFKKPRPGEAIPTSCDVVFSVGSPKYGPLKMKLAFENGRAISLGINWGNRDDMKSLEQADISVWHLDGKLRSAFTMHNSLTFDLKNGLAIQTIDILKGRDKPITLKFNEGRGKFVGAGEDRERTLDLENALEIYKAAVAAINLEAIPD